MKPPYREQLVEISRGVWVKPSQVTSIALTKEGNEWHVNIRCGEAAWTWKHAEEKHGLSFVAKAVDIIRCAP